MATIDNIRYNAAISKLEAIADGAKKHNENVKVSALINENTYREIKNKLTQARQDYLDKEVETRKAYDEFDRLFKEANQIASDDSRILKGIFGRQGENLKDFGVNPEKNAAKSKAKTK